MEEKPIKHAKKFDHLYPEEGEPWTDINGEALEKKGWNINDGYYIHSKAPYLGVTYNDYAESWLIAIAEPFVNESKEDSIRWKRLRYIKYTYQIDNMFHGFTDRWLGYI